MASNENGNQEDEDKEPVDVSHYTLEEKIVAAVWVHERPRNHMPWDQIMKNFKYRFKNKPPSKQTLLQWERKLFSTGNAHDKTRSGRPIARLMHVPYVKQSIAESPNLSIRERAKELGLPYATLLKILKEDLKMAYIPDEEAKRKIAAGCTTANTGTWKFLDETDINNTITSTITSNNHINQQEALTPASSTSNSEDQQQALTSEQTSQENVEDSPETKKFKVEEIILEQTNSVESVTSNSASPLSNHPLDLQQDISSVQHDFRLPKLNMQDYIQHNAVDYKVYHNVHHQQNHHHHQPNHHQQQLHHQQLHHQHTTQQHQPQYNNYAMHLQQHSPHESLSSSPPIIHHAAQLADNSSMLAGMQQAAAAAVMHHTIFQNYTNYINN